MVAFNLLTPPSRVKEAKSEGGKRGSCNVGEKKTRMTTEQKYEVRMFCDILKTKRFKDHVLKEGEKERKKRKKYTNLSYQKLHYGREEEEEEEEKEGRNEKVN